VQIVVDASVLVAALMKPARVRGLFLRPGIEWVAPTTVRSEILANVPTPARALRLSVPMTHTALEHLLAHVTFVPVSAHEPAFLTATGLIGRRDASDVPVVAVALRVGSLGIWSLDHDFDGIRGLPRLSTAAIARLLELVAPLEEE
jgi:predicted nucleic acid-binding protein